MHTRHLTSAYAAVSASSWSIVHSYLFHWPTFQIYSRICWFLKANFREYFKYDFLQAGVPPVAPPTASEGYGYVVNISDLLVHLEENAAIQHSSETLWQKISCCILATLPFKAAVVEVSGNCIIEASNGNRCMSGNGYTIGGIRRIRMNLNACWAGSTGPGPKIPGWIFFGGKSRSLQQKMPVITNYGNS